MKKLAAVLVLGMGIASIAGAHGTKTPSPKHNSPKQATPRDFTTPRCGTKTPSPPSTPRK